MTPETSHLHVYRRDLRPEERTSLHALADLIEPGACVLDLGCGSGALGRVLVDEKACVVDGVTLNPEEARLAKDSYRRVEVCDLENADLSQIFRAQLYDNIVCADVLEHLRHPRKIMHACRGLLKKGGRLLISVPNMAYAGLVAELMLGKFQYRPEGLLDHTHLRFFTREALLEFLDRAGFDLYRLETIERRLAESEFRVSFDLLPPSVSKHLLAMRDALTYQFIAATAPRAADHAEPNALAMTPKVSHDDHPLNQMSPIPEFTAQLYWRGVKGFDEHRKVVKSGVIGEIRQTLNFVLPVEPSALDGLRFDPADRPGLIHLYRIGISDGGSRSLAAWHADAPGVELEVVAGHQTLLLPTPESEAAVVLLTGEDPRIEIGFSESLKDRLRHLPSGETVHAVFELSWPMGADFVALLKAVQAGPKGSAGAKAWLNPPQFAAIEHRDAQDTHSRLETGLGLVRLLQQLQNAEETAKSATTAVKQAGEREEFLRVQLDTLAAQTAVLTAQGVSQRSNLRRLEQDRASLIQHLQWIENSTLFRVTRPLVKAKSMLDSLLRNAASNASRHANAGNAKLSLHSGKVELPSAPVDVIVPVYKNLTDTQRCLRSVLSSSNRTPMRLLVINDASPEPAVTQWLRDLAAVEPRLELLENTQNLGFVGTVNRGMRHGVTRDVVLLNSDTEVANDWLDRLLAAAYQQANSGTVTPFSNNATICSFPVFCQDNDLPPGMSTAALDQVFAETLKGQVLEVPTGVGFCMFIRRACLQEVGYFDEASFGKGYGEENDFCVRASRAGWKNLHALDVFVLHAGGSSFGDSKSSRELAAMDTLRRLHPDYEYQVHRYVQSDPAKSARLEVEMALLRGSELPRVLVVLHDRAGGTLRHVKELVKDFSEKAHFFTLMPTASGVLLKKVGPESGLQHTFRIQDEFDLLLSSLKFLGIGLVHYHHVLGHDKRVLELAGELGVPHDVTFHDYYMVCPQITLTDTSNRYCGELGIEQCNQCLHRSPAPGGGSIQAWRLRHQPLIDLARYVIVPSRDVGRRVVKYFPAAKVCLAPHTDLSTSDLNVLVNSTPHVREMPGKRVLKVAILGALSSIKGADVLEQVALLAAQRSEPVEFHLLGYAYRHLKTQPKAALTVHGAYDDEDLPRMIEWLDPDLIWFPAQWPETYSYTLSAALLSNKPLVVPDVGAFQERVAGRPWSWVVAWGASAEGVLNFLLQIRTSHFLTQRSPKVADAPEQNLSDAGIRSGWSYPDQYLLGLKPGHTPPMAQMPEGVFRNTSTPLSSLPQGLSSRVKALVLWGLIRLRSSAMVGRLASRIPLRYQTRIKSWLRS